MNSAPENVRPKRRAQAQTNNKRNLILGILGGFVLILLVLTVLQRIDNALNDGPAPTHIENRFIDIDNDGDADYIERADILFNCGGYYCQPTPASQATLAPQATPAPPTPQVFSPDPDPN